MIYDGGVGGIIEVRDDGITIRRKGLGSLLTQGIKGEKRIPYASISAVQFKEAGFTSGYLQVSLVGGVESRGGVMAATQDENTVMFTKPNAARFRELRDLIEQRAAAARTGGRPAPAPVGGSISEELTQLTDLRDRGILSDEEFAAEKQALLANRSGSAPVAAPTPLPSPSAPAVGLSEAPKSGGVGKKLGIGCLVAFGILVALAMLGSQVEKNAPSTGAGAGESGSGEVAPAMEVTSVQLAAAYAANEAAAQQTYGGKPLLVTGRVEGITLDFSDDPVIQLQGSNQFLNVQANLSESSKPKASGISKGQTLTVRCEDVSEVISAPILKDCEIQ